ncbi:hypothetical protein IQ22_02824 [Pseudomonas duriflava]|uniref:Tip attachment protein J HDII-ins2 domain-containing protein n=1 Tax=Pseudomonas duriflava TaxID=459528 RepID=A0A562Q8D1_9PSED|nr:host specificity factor TipJ family phage tail protein [Pseudomonas duriflava]TWI52989.1 hypothetical protein IQ22_02824 [Pseudomonas duriflava]
MIEVYPSKLEGEPLERWPTKGVMTLEAWLKANIPSYESRESPPISIEINGVLIEPKAWGVTLFSSDDTVAIWPEPKKSGATALISLVSTVMSVITSLFTTKTPSSATLDQGKDLNLSNAAGNQVKLGDIIREVSGRTKIYPDYLLPPRRYFTDVKTQWAEILLCVGVGEFEISAGDVKIGDTALASLGDTASYKVFGPGADLSGEAAAKWWHSSDEVGSTSTGSAGLTLKATFALTQQAAASTYLLSGYQVTVPEGAGWFPEGWTSGLIARIEAIYPYTYTNLGDGSATVVSGIHVAMINPHVGMAIEITGDNAGSYVIGSVETNAEGEATSFTLNYEGGAPASGLQSGALNSAIGYQGLRYRITAVSDDAVSDDDDTTTDHGPSTLTVERLTDTGAEDDSWTGFNYLNSASAVITLDTTTLEGDWVGPFAACPEGEVTSAIEVDTFFPQGLVNFNSKTGARGNYSCTVEIQYRDMTTLGSWVSVTKTYTNRTPDQLGYTQRIDLPTAIRPEVRLRRIGEESSSSDKYDRVQWYGLRARLDKAPPSYPDVTVMAVYVKGGDRLSAQSESQISVVATRKLPTLSAGAWTAPVATRDIVPWVNYVAKSIGYTDDDLDLEEMARLGAIWSSRDDYFDYAVEDSSTVKECINDALLAGFAEFTLDRGQLKPVRDEPRTVYEHMYTPQNMTEPLKRTVTLPAPDDYDGVDVKYTDSTTWADETVTCRLPGDAGLMVKEITVNGVTDRDRAWRIGMRRRREYAFRNKGYSWSTELDALNSGYLSFDAVADDIPGYGQSALLMDYFTDGTMTVLESSEPLKWEEGASHVVALRRPDGSVSGPWPAIQMDDYRLAVQALDFTPDTSWSIEPPHLLFGTTTRWSYPVLITSVTPGDYSADVEAIGYDERVYADDDNYAPDNA